MLLATAEDAGRAVDMFSGYMWQTRVLEVRLDRMVGEGGAVGYEQQLGQQQQMGGMGQLGGGMGQQQYAGMVQQMLSPSIGQLGLSGTLSPYAKHNLGLGSLSGPGSPSVGGSSTPASMSASTSGSASASGSRPSLPTSVSGSLTGQVGVGWSEEVAYAVVFCVSAARSRTRSRTNAGYDAEQKLVRWKCEFTSNSRLYPMSVYIAYIHTLSRFYPFIPFPFLILVLSLFLSRFCS